MLLWHRNRIRISAHVSYFESERRDQISQRIFSWFEKLFFAGILTFSIGLLIHIYLVW